MRNNGGGHYNHSLFWESMSPDGGGEPSGALGDAINSAFGSFDDFKTKLKETGVGQFGSGWAWLVHDGSGLAIVGTPNQDSPLSKGQTPLRGRRRLGARLLPEVPEQAPRLHRRVVQHDRLGQGLRALRGRGLSVAAAPDRNFSAVRRSLRSDEKPSPCAALRRPVPRLAAPAAASRDQESIFEDEHQLLELGPGGRLRPLDDIDALGADSVRSLVLWARLAPRGGGPGFKAADPRAYPPAAWDPV